MAPIAFMSPRPRRGRRGRPLAALAVGLCACGKAPLPPPPSPPSPFVTISGATLRDADGGQILLRGFDLSGRDKTAPYFPGLDLPDGGFAEWSSAALAPLSAAGFNAVRYLVVWAAIEPDAGSYDEGYLDHAVTWIQGLEDAGFWVVVDMHQDLYSQAFAGLGDGFPPWTCPASEYQSFDANWDGGAWFAAYESPQITACFDHLWQDADGVQEAFAAAWAQLAGRLANEPRVLGYDLLNEPWSGSANAGDGTFGSQLLQPFYEKVMAAIRAVDPHHLFFLEPAALTVDTLSPSDMQFHGGDVVYFPHYYVVGAQLTGPYRGLSAPPTAVPYLAPAAPAGGGVPWALGEWATYPPNRAYAQEVPDVLDQIDASNGSGFCWWDENPNVSNTLLAFDGGPSCIQGMCALELLSRPHPLRIAGSLSSFAWNADAGVASLDFTGGADGPTVMWLPGAAWSAGPQISTNDPAGWSGSWDAEAGAYLYLSAGAGPHALTFTP